MKYGLLWSASFMAIVLGFSGAGQAADVPAGRLRATTLRCESLVDPLGIDTIKPRLSWALLSNHRNARQTAYQVRVASTRAKLDAGDADIWDSGRVGSGETNQIEYAGVTLKARQACFWAVRAWDDAGQPGPWSAAAQWELGLLDLSDWSARWIGAPARLSDGHVGIVHAEYVTEDGKVSKDVTSVVKGLLRDGSLQTKVTNDAFGGDLAYGKVKELRVTYTLDGKAAEARFTEGNTAALPLTPLPYLRRAFTVSPNVRQVRLYATAMGIYSATLNGNAVGDQVLAPDWTDYRKRVRYQTYDVTSLVKSGANAIAFSVADGWYAGHIGNGGYRYWGDRPAVMAQLEIVYDDGTTERVITDGQWRVGASPVLQSDFMLGETYDARAEVPNVAAADFDDHSWKSAEERTIPAVPLQAPVGPPVRELAALPAKSISEPQPGHYVFDLGQNMVGVVRLKVKASAGTTITLRHAEMLNADGTMYTRNYRGAPSVDRYTCRSAEAETWQPRFTFHGFRYVELTGLNTKPELDAVTGIVLGTDVPKAGTFGCSDPRINQLQSNIEWGQRGNFLSVPTDCPQRDERLGWMGDAGVFTSTAVYNADISAFFAKWLEDVDDAQSADGRYADVSPRTANGDASPAWADAGVICPWVIYRTYGDRRQLARHLPGMIRWVEWCRAHSDQLVRRKDRGSDFGDWLSIKADTPKDLIGTAYFAHSAHLVAESARALGMTEEATKYDRLFDDIRTAFVKEYRSTDGQLKGDTQTAYALALMFDLLPPDQRIGAADRLAADVHAKGDHLSTGFIGVSFLLPALSNAGHLDTAYRLLMQDTFPSWLFSVKHGATTIWERWDGWTPDKGFQDPGMNSFNHYSLGSCGQWLYEDVAGISQEPGSVGFAKIVIRPQATGPLTEAYATYDSPRGPIASAWRIADGRIRMDVTVPPNTTATVYVPTADPTKVQEAGKPVATVDGVRNVRAADGMAVLQIGSGTYAFSAPAR